MTWTLVIASAPWGGRYWHTSVVDAAGAIYVLGGFGSGRGYLHDVWKSTDGGASPGVGRGVHGRVLRGY